MTPVRFATVCDVRCEQQRSRVVLEANPLDDIRATRTIAAVIAGGRLYDRSALDALMAVK